MEDRASVNGRWLNYTPGDSASFVCIV